VSLRSLSGVSATTCGSGDGGDSRRGIEGRAVILCCSRECIGEETKEEVEEEPKVKHF
jgi:hypothetical protein